MVKLSIICLIYRSASLADWVWSSLLKYTPMLARGEAEFFFVANDPTAALISYLHQKQYPFIVNKNVHYTEEQLYQRGYAIPEYMNRVYRGYNSGIMHAKGERVVLINSDNFFSPDWLENLSKYSDIKTVISSTLVERRHEKFGVFPSAIEKNFGSDVETFEEDAYVKFTYQIKKTGIKPGGAYMPCMLYRDVAIYAGLYPEGNLAGKSKEEVVRYGDESFFDKLAELGVEHYTSLDSIAYHLKEGEREDVVLDGERQCDDDDNVFQEEYGLNRVQKHPCRISPLAPTDSHNNIITALLATNRIGARGRFPFLRRLLGCVYHKEKKGNQRIIRILGTRIYSYHR
ncbi:MAG: glycosyltransferase family 2 protein [Planctomycetaceae bacterium]|nr:glycosyltransferase family 2 protein [Planctomycetaceae bacterium]